MNDTIITILAIYALNVFLNRWLNIRLVRAYKSFDYMPFLWFMSLVGTLFFIVGLVLEITENWNSESKYSRIGTIDKVCKWFFNPKRK